MKGKDFEHTDENDRIIVGRAGKASIIIYKGIKGTVQYWAGVVGISWSSMRYRFKLIKQKKTTIERALDPTLFDKAPNKYKGLPKTTKRKSVSKTHILPSGIPEVRSLIQRVIMHPLTETAIKYIKSRPDDQLQRWHEVFCERQDELNSRLLRALVFSKFERYTECVEEIDIIALAYTLKDGEE